MSAASDVTALECLITSTDRAAPGAARAGARGLLRVLRDSRQPSSAPWVLGLGAKFVAHDFQEFLAHVGGHGHVTLSRRLHEAAASLSTRGKGTRAK